MSCFVAAVSWRFLHVSTQFDTAEDWNLHVPAKPAKPSSTAWEVLESSIKRIYSKLSVCTFMILSCTFFTTIWWSECLQDCHSQPNQRRPHLPAQNGQEIKMVSHFLSWNILKDSSVSSPRCHCLWGHIEGALDLDFQSTPGDERVEIPCYILQSPLLTASNTLTIILSFYHFTYE